MDDSVSPHAHAERSGPSASETTDPAAAQEISALRQRVMVLERAVFADTEKFQDSGDGAGHSSEQRSLADAPPVSGSDPQTRAEEPSRFWALEMLQEQVPEPGAVMLVGSVTAPNGQHAQWQYGTVADDIFGSDFSSRAESMSALAHAVRLRILQHLLSGAETVQDLTAADAFGTSGQIYHHLKILVSAGWLSAGQRGHYYVPAERLVPLLAILTGATR